MKIFLYILTVFACVACKENYYYDYTENTDTKRDTVKSDSIKDEDKQLYVTDVNGYYNLTLKDVYRVSSDMKCIVEGYIVGESRNRLRNAVYTPPFAWGYNIIISNSKVINGKMEENSVCVLVQLTGETEESVHKELQLKNYPEHHNWRVKLYGRTGRYYQEPCITGVTNYEYTEAVW